MKIIHLNAASGLFALALIVLPFAAFPDSHVPADTSETGMPPPEPAPERDIVIGGGAVAGVYFPAAGAICRVLSMQETNRRCLVESNVNSSVNLERLANGLLDFAVVQSDWLMHASRGTSLFRPNGPDETLRAVLSLHAEALTLVTRAGAGIETPEDLEGKRVNLGPAYTYQRVLTETLLRAAGLDEDDLALVTEMSVEEQFTALCTGELDAAAIVAAHPTPVLVDAMQRCDLRLIAIAGKRIDALLKDRTELAPAVVPGGLYTGAPDDVETFGLRAVLATTTQVEDEIVRALVEAVLGEFSTFAAQHPALGRLDRKAMARAGIAVPLHPGAENAFKTHGFLP
ncbi:MAG: TAXI family TRAP transporter solute-binding subunit [Rhodospirillales bacterium]|nr:MAG: TAXI family TRAP transporter solute-binding subunit [Rhodospirillales bacterium]